MNAISRLVRRVTKRHVKTNTRRPVNKGLANVLGEQVPNNVRVLEVRARQ